ncbi:hypothetical protein CATMIT_01553, partial [Catenibacterium mitsuokai DSM 15897]
GRTERGRVVAVDRGVHHALAQHFGDVGVADRVGGRLDLGDHAVVAGLGRGRRVVRQRRSGGGGVALVRLEEVGGQAELAVALRGQVAGEGERGAAAFRTVDDGDRVRTGHRRGQARIVPVLDVAGEDAADLLGVQRDRGQAADGVLERQGDGAGQNRDLHDRGAGGGHVGDEGVVVGGGDRRVGADEVRSRLARDRAEAGDAGRRAIAVGEHAVVVQDLLAGAAAGLAVGHGVGRVTGVVVLEHRDLGAGGVAQAGDAEADGRQGDGGIARQLGDRRGAVVEVADISRSREGGAAAVQIGRIGRTSEDQDSGSGQQADMKLVAMHETSPFEGAGRMPADQSVSIRCKAPTRCLEWVALARRQNGRGVCKRSDHAGKYLLHGSSD